MLSDASFRAFKDGVSSALVDTTWTAGQISNEDLAFHRTLNADITPLLETQCSRLLSLVGRLTKSTTSGTEVVPPQISDVDSIEDNWKGIVDVVDNLLEKADAFLDEYTGAVRRLSPRQEERIKAVAPPARKPMPGKAYRTQDIAKPQLLFAKVPKNDERVSFRPLIRSKPHAIVPLEESCPLVSSSNGFQHYKHPYEIEIKESQYPVEIYAHADPILYKPFETTKAGFVDTPEALMSMLEELKLATELAVDLEHHDEHSYVGLVSLMQISTRDKDWVVDTLKPWRQELQILNEVFTDPKIIKVFHGAYMDMIWLQRDFGLYVVGLFDTFHASQSLGYPRNSLAYLLKRFANFDAAKQYQMADWRIRPLPDAMFEYARSDTHFLLYVYDGLRNELIENSDTSNEDGDLIKVVMNKSKEESLQRYERPIYDTECGMGAMGWYNLVCRTPALFNREQFAVFKAVHQWRDIVARQEDESTHMIMSKQNLFNIAREAPTDMPSLIGCSHPLSKLFQERKGDLLQVIKQAKAEAPMGPDMKDFIGTLQPIYAQGRSNGAEYTCKIPASQTTTYECESVPSRPTMKASSVAKTSNSVFWGTITLTGMSTLIFSDDSFRLALPLPHLMAEEYEKMKSVGGNVARKSNTHSKDFVEGREAIEEDSQREFLVIKQAGSLRKRKTYENQDPPEATLSKLTALTTHNIAEKGDQKEISDIAKSNDTHLEDNKKRRLKQAKRAKREARKPTDSIPYSEIPTTRESEEIEAFDYANAPSVLHAKRNSVKAEVKGGNEAENPYTKGMNAPKGLRKTRNETGNNKSFTFKG